MEKHPLIFTFTFIVCLEEASKTLCFVCIKHQQTYTNKHTTFLICHAEGSTRTEQCTSVAVGCCLWQLLVIVTSAYYFSYEYGTNLSQATLTEFSHISAVSARFGSPTAFFTLSNVSFLYTQWNSRPPCFNSVCYTQGKLTPSNPKVFYIENPIACQDLHTPQYSFGQNNSASL